MRIMKENGNKAGFTLVEILLVIVIIGVLATIVVANFSGRQKEAMVSATRASISGICTGIDAFELDTGRFPSSLESLLKSDGSPNWKGPYLRLQSVPADPWGTAFQFTAKDSKIYEVRSAGPDKQMGTEDDLTN